MNSQPNRLGEAKYASSGQRDAGIEILAPHSKAINCIVHDTGMGAFLSMVSAGWELYGNLVYYNGNYAPIFEQEHAVSVDLIPAGGVAVALSGTYHKQETGATSITITDHVNAGDYTLVAAAKNGLDYTTMTATFDGAAMTLLVGLDGYSKSVAMFGIKGHTVTADVVVNSGDANVVRAIAQSFVNVNQNATETLNAVPGTFTVADGAMSINDATLTSATGGFTAYHAGQPIEVAGAGLSGASLKTYVASYTDSNTLELVHTAYANVSGKAVTIRGGTWWNNQWGDGADRMDGSQPGVEDQDPTQAALLGNNLHIKFNATTPSDTNHMVVDAIGIYQAFSTYNHPGGDNTYSVSDAAMSTGSTTLTSTTGGFTAAQQGFPIRVVGAGTDGAVLYTTITTVSDTNTLVLANANASGGNVTGALAVVHNMIGGPCSTILGQNPHVRMSFATRTGAGLVDMRWDWTPKIDVSGHGAYVQSGGSDSCATTSGNATIAASDYPPHSVLGPWRSQSVGAQIRILGAGVAGADLVTTIATVVDNSTITVNSPLPGATITAEGTWGWPAKYKHNIVWDNWYEAIQIYGSSGAAGINVDAEGNFWFHNTMVLGGLTGYRMTDSVVHDNYSWSNSADIGYDMGHMRNFRLENNYFHDNSLLGVESGTWDDMVIAGNTFIGTTNALLSTNFPDNTFQTTDPVVNKIVVLPNDYEANRCNILVYNWENLTTVDVDISSAVAIGTPINVMNSRDYFSTPVLTTTYTGGTITLPMTDLTVASVICDTSDPLATFTPQPSTAPAFAAFIVRAQSEETWR